MNLQITDSNKAVALIIPVFNDWESLDKLICELEAAIESTPIRIAAFLIDDASTEPVPRDQDLHSRSIKITLVRLTRNLGHQRAIFAGLKFVSELNFSHALVMDSDGEDTPSGVLQLLAFVTSQPNELIVAKRGHRRENLTFRIFYRAHKAVFRLLVGKNLDFGNFCLLPIRIVRSLVLSGDAAINLPSTILRSETKVLKVKVDRGARYFGKSKMNFEKLVAHSFSALAVFADQIMVRLTIFSLLSTLLSALGIGLVLIIRFASEAATPGWATAAIGLLMVISIQVLGFVGLGSLISLNLSALKNLYQDDVRGSQASDKHS